MTAHRRIEKEEGNVVEVGKMVNRKDRTQPKQGCKWVFRFALAGIVLSMFSHLWAQDASIATRMQEVVRRFVLETGYQIIGVGSWITGTGYQPGHSDHDMRLLLPRGTSPQEAQRAWATAQQRLREMIKQEFGEQAQRILQRTNLYPPSQLMQGVESAEDALERFMRYQRVPNLGYTGPVGPNTPARLTEGLYGPGADAYIKSYERTSGRLFYRDGGKVYAGLTDLTHLSEGVPRYTISGTANTAAQWASHLIDDLEAGREAQRLIKVLERLERDLVKSRDLARLGTDFPLRDQIRSLIAKLRDNPTAVGAMEDAIRQTARRAATEAAILNRYGNAGPLQRLFLRDMLEASNTSNALSQTIAKVTEKLPNVSMDHVIRGLLLVYVAHTTSRAVGEGDIGRAISEGMLPFVGLPVGVMTQITQAILESARETGYQFAAGSQTAIDLLEGIFTGLGRAGVSERRYTLDQLVENIHTEEGLRSFVWARAQEAAARDWGPAGAIHDLGTAEAIFQRCYPAILQAWQMRRELLAMEILDLVDGLESQSVVLTYQPCPAQLQAPDKPVNVTVTAATTGTELSESVARIRRNLHTLLGRWARPFVYVGYRWSPGGSDGYRDNEQIYTYRQPGRYQVSVEQVISIGAVNSPQDFPLRREIKRTAMVDIEVTPKEKPAEPPAAVGDFVLVRVESRKSYFHGTLEAEEKWSETSYSLREPYASWKVTWTCPPAVIKPGEKVNITLTFEISPPTDATDSVNDATAIVRVESYRENNHSAGWKWDYIMRASRDLNKYRLTTWGNWYTGGRTPKWGEIEPETRELSDTPTTTFSFELPSYADIVKVVVSIEVLIGKALYIAERIIEFHYELKRQ